jgi:hypothetical protein
VNGRQDFQCGALLNGVDLSFNVRVEAEFLHADFTRLVGAGPGPW